VHAPVLDDVFAELFEHRLQHRSHFGLQPALRSVVGRQQQQSASIHQR